VTGPLDRIASMREHGFRSLAFKPVIAAAMLSFALCACEIWKPKVDTPAEQDAFTCSQYVIWLARRLR